MTSYLFCRKGLFILVLVISLSVFGAAQPITAPAVITSPGTYELTADARSITDVYGIKIECSDVILDGQSHFLGGDNRDKSVGVFVNKYGGSITNVTVKNLKLEDWDTAISYKYVKGQEGDVNEIENLDIIDSLTGIHIEYSDVVTVNDNMIRDCSTGINIEQNSNKVTLTENILKDNGAGVHILNTVDVTLKDNNINSCSVFGVQVTDSAGFTLIKNSISDNKYAALKVENSKDSIITDNNFSKTETGPVVVIGNGVTGAEIYNNYFASRENISVDEISSNIAWNTSLEVGVNILGGPYKGGNYWGSAPGLNGYSDDVKDEDGFGIGDVPYEINTYNIDHLPLTNTDKNYPAPTPEPTEAVFAETINETVSDESITSGNETVISEEISVPAAMESVEENVNTTESADNSTDELSMLPAPVQNEYVGEESAFSALGSEVIHVKEETETNSSIPADTNSTKYEPVKNGYLLFTGLTPGNQVTLVTSTGAEINLDKVMTSTLSVPVPVGMALYSSWRVLQDGQVLADGTIIRYPAADETVLINIMEIQSNEVSNLTKVITNESQATILQLSDLQPADAGEDEIILSDSVNTTPTPVVPPKLTYVPQGAGAENSNAMESIVMMNSVDGGLVPGYVITAYAGQGGEIFPEGEVNVMAGGNVTFIITPFDGKKIEYLLVNGSPVDVISEYLFTNVTQNHTIIAGFN